MLTFTEFEWTAFIYWAVSYGGNQDYVPLMTNTPFLKRLKENPDELSADEIRDKIIDFLNRWKCRISNDSAETVKEKLVETRPLTQSLSDKRLFDVNDSLKSSKTGMMKLYEKFDSIPHFGATATSKILHIINPDLFVMWDQNILKHYHHKNLLISDSAQGYVAFLSLMSEMGREVTLDFHKSHPQSSPEVYLCEKLGYNLQKSLAKFIDEYNWITITKGIAVPPNWWPQKPTTFPIGVSKTNA